MRKTSVEIDKRLIDQAKKLLGASSIKETIDSALREVARNEARRRCRDRNRRSTARRPTRPSRTAPHVAFAVRDIGTTDQASDQVTDQVARLLAELRNGPKSAIELMAALGLSHRPTFRSNYIRPAFSAGLVEMTRPESQTARNQKYRLTARGWSAAG